MSGATDSAVAASTVAASTVAASTVAANDDAGPRFAGPAAEAFATPEFLEALSDAELLLDYAASHGQLPAVLPEDMVQNIVLARQAWEARRVTAQIAIGFWVAYANLSKLTNPVSAESLRACKKATLLAEKIGATLLVLFIIVFSVFLFMNNTTAVETADLIEQQNAAALRLWTDLQILRPNSGDPASVPSGARPALESQSSTAFVNRVFGDAVEFSRKSQWLLQSASKLHFWFNRWWTDIDIRSVTFDKDNPYHIDHLLIPPETSRPDEILSEVQNQIKAYQVIRNYALALDKTDSIIYGGITTYVLPTVYALLGAFLYGFRLYARLIRRKTYLRTAVRSARFYIAAIAGLVVGLFGSLLPKNLALSPLAVAFLVGYAVEAFFSRLDDLIATFKGDAPAAQSSASVAPAALPAPAYSPAQASVPAQAVAPAQANADLAYPQPA